MTDTEYSCSRHYLNRRQDNGAHREFAAVLPQADCVKAKEVISGWADYAPTPLLELDDIATAARVGSVLYKDESGRFGLGSFKALGGSYAVSTMAATHQAEHGQLDGFVVATATDGNHGRSVAWGAQRLGIECHIFIHAHVSAERADAMAGLGAVVHRVEGNYDDSVAACIAAVREQNWHMVSDTSWPGYETVPIQVMAGYSVMASEILDQLGGQVPSHMIIPAGCGGLAGGMLAYFWQHWQDALPAVILVESDKSDCIYQSLRANEMSMVHIEDETIMAGLSCGEVSRIAWPLIQKGVRHVITLGDDGVVPMMRWLAKPTSAQRPPVEGGECATACLIALLAAARDPALQQACGLDASSTVLVFGTEGATDRNFYDSVVTS